MNTVSPESVSARVANLFTRIHREQMDGVPLLNRALSVQTLGFQVFEGRVLGMVITPWMMSLLLLPGTQDDWAGEALGNKHVLAFPGGSFRFMINVLDDIGVCQMHSLHSPMHQFSSQATAVTEAEAFVQRLLTAPVGGVPDDPVDEELLGKILRGEKVPQMDKNGSLIPESAAQPIEPTPSLETT